MSRTVDGCCRKKKRTLAKASKDLIMEWDYQKNEGLTPSEIKIHDTRSVHWVCQYCGHQFQNSVKNRYYRKSKCPQCLGREMPKQSFIVSVEQSLEYLFPYLMKEWHPVLNANLNAFELAPKSGIQVWWQCSSLHCSHQWRTPIFQRTCQTPECPACTNKEEFC